VRSRRKTGLFLKVSGPMTSDPSTALCAVPEGPRPIAGIEVSSTLLRDRALEAEESTTVTDAPESTMSIPGTPLISDLRIKWPLLTFCRGIEMYPR